MYDRIIITGIDEAAGKDNITAAGAAFGFGQRVVNTRRDSLDITVRFALNIKNKNMAAREELLEKVKELSASKEKKPAARKTKRK